MQQVSKDGEMALIYALIKLHKAPNVQECDASGDAQWVEAGLIILLVFLFAFLIYGEGMRFVRIFKTGE